VAFCSYVSVEPFVQAIRDIIEETPECKLGPVCALPTIVSYVLQEECDDFGCALPGVSYVLQEECDDLGCALPGVSYVLQEVCDDLGCALPAIVNYAVAQ
jgi:hypothetical protein